MMWNHFIWFAMAAVFCWVMGALESLYKERKRVVYVFTGMGLIIFFVFIIGLWISLERPPLRTMGETRLWYSFLLPMAGVIVYARWHYKWILSYSALLSLVFICVNLLKPEIHSKILMPALQSVWFVPHVIVYMFSYAMMGAATVSALYLLLIKKGKVEVGEMNLCDNSVYIGFSFMTLGMLLGALWANDAWGHFWAWDPKETWAAITWFSYLVYIHFRLGYTYHRRLALLMLLLGFAFLQMCWWGINYLPSARDSIHVYTRL